MPASRTAVKGRLACAAGLGGDVWALLGTLEKPPGPARSGRRSPLARPGSTAVVFALDRDETAFLALAPARELAEKGRLDFGPVAVGSEDKSAAGRQIDCDELAVRLSAADLPSRARCLNLLSEATALCEPSRRAALAKALYRLRQGLRDPLRREPVEGKPVRALHIDALFGIDDRSFYVRGWMHDAESPVVALTAISPEGRHLDLTGRLYRYERPDVAEHYGLGKTTDPLGFLGYFELPSDSVLSAGWVFTSSNAAGDCIEAPGPPVEDVPERSRSAILADLLHDPGDNSLLAQHTFPAVSRLQDRLAASVAIARTEQYGPAVRDPEVSIVVPLYRRIDFVEHQMAHFFHDPDMRSAELIYVLDSPEQAADLAKMARQLWSLYGIAFKTVILNRNGGFSAANNLGASVAKGKLLLLMNSDVIPEQPGWLSEMSAFYRRTDRIGALGPKLVYEDSTLQHAGLQFRWTEDHRCWLNVHCYQGMHRDFPAAQIARTVPGVTGACLMIDAGLYRRLGGLRGMYMQGDFEDSDLCLRLADLGLSSRYLPGVCLYHLEGQSYPGEMRRLAFRYNSWLHTLLWGDRIAGIMEAFESAIPAPDTNEVIA